MTSRTTRPLQPGQAKHCPLCGSLLTKSPIQGRERQHCSQCEYVLYVNPVSGAAGVVFDGEGRVLLVRRKMEPFRDQWALPAGYQEADESSQTAVQREVQEETGLKVRAEEVFDAVLVQDFRKPANVVVHLCRLISGEIKVGDEESDVQWFALDALPEPLGFNNAELLKRVADGGHARRFQPEAKESAGKAGGLSYVDAGVNIDAAVDTLNRSKDAIRATFNAGVQSDIGLFGGLFDMAAVGAANELLVASADGVGSKLEVAKLAGIYDTVGRDLVQHCINDILVQGARPWFFMDYVGVGKLEPAVAADLIRGCASACSDHGVALLGGETAEMPGLYAPGDFDLVGFVVGSVVRERMLDGSRVRPGQVLLGLTSDGLHTNGYSLARKIVFERLGLDVHSRPDALGGVSVAEALLQPHRCYLKPLWPLIETDSVAALAHITGGGLQDNLPRVLGECDAIIDPQSWPIPPLFQWLCDSGGVSQAESMRVFNMGIGMVVLVEPERADDVTAQMQAAGETVYRLGHVQAGSGQVRFESEVCA